MDIQGNISIEIVNRNGPLNRIVLNEELIRKHFELGNPLFEIDERKGFTITLDDYFMYSILIDGPDSKNYKLDSERKTLKMFFEDEYNYIPGNYYIEISGNLSSYRCYFKVLPSAMTERNLFDLRASIEMIQEGLSKDTNKTRASFDLYKHDSSLSNEYFIIQNYKTYSNYLKNIVGSIVKDPKVNLEKSYSVKPDIGLKGRETERWFETKGQKINQANNSIIFYLDSKVIQNLDNPVNRIFKSKLIEIVVALDSIEKKLFQKIVFLKSRENAIMTDINEKESQIELVNISSERDSIRRDIIRRKDELKEVLERNEALSKERKYLESEIRYFNRFINTSWLAKIDEFKIADKKAVLPIQYRHFINTLNKVLKSQNKNAYGSRNYDFAYRETPYLFEVYILLSMHSILRDNGFEALTTDIYHENFGFIDAIVESKLLYKKNDLTIEVRYDNQVNKYSYKKKSDFYNLNAYRNRPDFLISKYRDGKLLDSFIVESKCVKHKYLFNEYESTEISEQLKDYLSFCFVEKENSNYILKKGVIRKVYVIYPDEDEELLYRDFEDIVYIGVNPSKDLNHNNLSRILRDELN